jgi:hypothetical protein
MFKDSRLGEFLLGAFFELYFSYFNMIHEFPCLDIQVVDLETLLDNIGR